MRSSFTVAERIDQTHETIRSIRGNGIDKILLVDNSPRERDLIKVRFSEGVELVQVCHPVFSNRGLGELLLLLSVLPLIPEDCRILKISGRYRLVDGAPLLGRCGEDLTCRLMLGPPPLSLLVAMSFDRGM